MGKPIYERVLIKISGEALAGADRFGINEETLAVICRNIKKLVDMGVAVGIVVGGGNFWRGRQNAKMDRTRADHMGMLATVINALGLADALEQQGIVVRVETAIEMKQNRGTLYQKPGHTSLGERPRGDFWLRHGKSFLYYRHSRRTAGCGNRRGCDSAGKKCGRRL